jgi:predicted transposase YdaD
MNTLQKFGGDYVFIHSLLLEHFVPIKEELEAMFSLDDLKQTRYFQDVMAEGERNAKLAAAPRLLALGLTVEQVAGALDLEVEVVRQIAASEVQNDAPTVE